MTAPVRPPRTPKPLFPDGIKVLHSCDDAVVDICFVHGLTGDRESTWTADRQSNPWPQTLLPSRLPRARILTFGYDAYVTRAGVASTNGIVGHAVNLVNDLVGNRESCNATSHRLIFVAHNLGGIVCKSALDYSRNNPRKHLQNVFDTVIGIVFLGTPHRGSWMADWARIPVSALGVWQSGNTKLMDVLRTNSELLETISDKFSGMIWGLKDEGRVVEVTCFYEELSLPVVGPVVKKESATLDSFASFSIHKNHRNMVKFASADDNGFVRLLNDLKRWTNNISLSNTTNPMPVLLAEQYPPFRPHREPPRPVALEQNLDFTGRADVLRLLHKLAAPKIHFTARVAIAGLGGIGKTQLALQYVYEQVQKHPDSAVFWISCVSRETIDRDYQAAVHELGGDNTVDQTDQTDDLAIHKLLRNQLGKKDIGRWILVFDNVDDISFWKDSQGTTPGLRGLIDCLPQSEFGTIIFTTRNHQVAVELARHHVVELSEMGMDDSRQLLRNYLIDKSLLGLENEKEMDKLLSRLASLPLALAQAAYYINRNRITISDYLGLLDSQEEETIELLGKGFEDGQLTHHPVATTWLISFEKIKKDNPLAADYISFMACTDSKDIPEALLPSVPSALARKEAIGTLRAYSFISTHTHLAKLLSMHRLVHLAARNWLIKENMLGTWMDQVVEKLTETLTDADEVRREQWRPSMPHAYYLLSQRTGSYQYGGPLFQLLKCYADCLRREGRYRDEETYRREVMDICETQLGNDHPSTLSAMATLAISFIQLGRYDDSVMLHEKTLQKRKEILDADHPDTLASMRNLANAYQSLGRFDEAANLHKETLQKRKEILGADHPDTLGSMNNLANAYQSLGRFDEAAKLYKETLQKRKEILRADHPDTLASMNNIANAYQSLDRFDEATKLYKETLQKRKEILGADHPDTLGSMNNLANTYDSLGRFDEAAKLHKETLQKRKEILGADHPDTLASMNNLANAYQSLGRFDEAAKLHKETLQKRKEILRADHPDTLASMNNLANAYQSLGRFDKAAKFHKETLQKRKEILGADHPDTLNSMENICFSLRRTRQQVRALEVMRSCVEASLRCLGPDHGDTLRRIYLVKRWESEGSGLLRFLLRARRPQREK